MWYLGKKIGKSIIITGMMVGMVWLCHSLFGAILGYINHEGIVANIFTNLKAQVITVQTLVLRYAPLITIIVFVALCINDILDYINNLILGKGNKSAGVNI